LKNIYSIRMVLGHILRIHHINAVLTVFQPSTPFSRRRIKMCDKCNWESYLDLADEILDDESLNFAEDTVMNIQAWIDDNSHVTENQVQALNNIYGSNK